MKTPILAMPVKPLLISALCVLCSGCLTTQKEAVLPQTGPTMQEVYDQHFQGQEGQGGSGSGSVLKAHGTQSPMGRIRRYGDDISDLSGYTRESYNETHLVFNRLPNPDLVMYVFPHVSGPEGSPIPGYSTAFSFYERVHYALPGEVED